MAIPKSKQQSKTNLVQSCTSCGRKLKDAETVSQTDVAEKVSYCECSEQEIAVGLPDLGESYEVIELIGKGGMGSVYKVKDLGSGETLAVKVLRAELADDKTAVKRFLNEVEALKALEHANIVSVIGSGETADGTPFLVMNYIEGTALNKALKEKGKLDPADCLSILYDLLDALSMAHSKGFIHRDLKPANVILTKEKAYLLDFGIAKVLPSQSASRGTYDITQTQSLIGTPHYMSPEQCLGFKLDERSDIYAIGCLIYEMLSGHPPFDCSNPIQAVVKHLEEKPLPFSKATTFGDSRSRKTLLSLETIALKCLEKEKESRYQSTAELLEALKRVSQGALLKRKEEKKWSVNQFNTASILLLMGLAACVAYYATIYDVTAFGVGANNRVIGNLYFTFIAASITFVVVTAVAIRHLIHGSRWERNWWHLGRVLLLAIFCISGATIAFAFHEIETVGMFYPSVTNFIGTTTLVHSFAALWSMVILTLSVLLPKERKINFAQASGRFFLSFVIAVSLPFLLPGPSAQLLNRIGTTTQFFALDESGVLTYRLALLLDRNNPESYKNLSNALANMGKSDEAVKTATFAVENGIGQIDERLAERAEIYKQTRQPQKAIADLTRAMELNPKNTYYYDSRARVKTEIGDYQGAIDDYSAVKDRQPSYALPQMARLYCLLRQFDKAVEVLKEEVEKDTTSRWGEPTSELRLAIILDGMGKKAEADNYYKQYLKDSESKEHIFGGTCLARAYAYKRLGNISACENELRLAGPSYTPDMLQKQVFSEDHGIKILF